MQETADLPTANAAVASGDMMREAGVALRNTIKLALSLTCTWSVTLLVRFQVPRFLGAAEFGQLNFSDAFAASFLACLDLGVDVYIQKEVSVRPKHASDFFGGLIVLRTLVAAALVAIVLAVLHITDRPREVQVASLVFALGYFLACINTTLGALLQASTRVGALALANVLAKLVWGGGLIACMATHRPMVIFAVPMVFSEVVRFAMLWPGARAAVGLRLRIDLGATWRAIVESLPYFISSAAIGITVRVNVNVLEFLVHDKREVGWLGAAANLGSLAMLMSPVLTWIVTPMLARARKRSVDDVYTILRFALEGLLVVCIPITLIIGVGADVWVRLAFGPSYAQAALALAAVAPQFVFTYTAMLLSIGLVILDQQWKATRNSLISLLLTPVFILVLVPRMAHLGEGGAAAGAALAVVLSEIVVSTSCLYYVGRRAVGRRTVLAAVKSAAVAAGVLVVDHFLRPLGPARIAVDLVLYVVGALASGAVRLREAAWALKAVRSQRAEARSGSV